MGIHLLGNEAEINGAGFVNAIDDTVKQDIAKSMLYTRIKPIESNSGETKFGSVKRKLKAVSNCWICEGW